MYLVYIVECSDGTFYTGITTDITRRVKEHNSSIKGAKYTKNRRPVSLVYVQEYPNRSEASKREYAIKKYTKKEKIELIKTKVV